VIVASVASRPTALRVRWLRFTGTISYGLYLYHYPIGAALALDLPVLVRAVVLGVLTFGAAIASWFWIERRFLRHREHRA
jgi:peptidoglycan/LPS O-acetylase OafA/YrhL